MQNELLREGFALMLAGMGTVFVFLTVLVFAMTIMSRLTLRFQSAPEAAGGPSGDEVAAIAAAIEKHRRK